MRIRGEPNDGRREWSSIVLELELELVLVLMLV